MSAHIAGERFGFAEPKSEPRFPEAWRDLDRAVWRWIIAHGGDEETAAAAAWASHAEGQGHSALLMTQLDEGGRQLISEAQKQALKRSAMVADAQADPQGTASEAFANKLQSCPLVLDGDYLYLLRNYRAEVDVANALRSRSTATSDPRCPLTDDDLRLLFNGSWSDSEERQRAAVRQVLGRRLMVLTGGPGTGKTTTVLRMLLALSREHQAVRGHPPQLRIAAPTGKAAQRLAESLRSGAHRLRGGGDSAQPLDAAWEPHLEAVLKADAATLHRLLGSRGARGGFTFHAGEPLPADIVVVDEASMLDLSMLRALLAALHEHAVLVLVGDADQLTSVGTGSVLFDIVQALESGAQEGLVRLTHCFRADLSLVPINEAVRSGNEQAFTEAVTAAAVKSAVAERPVAALHTVADAASLRRRLVAWAKDLQRLLEDVAVDKPLTRTDHEELSKRLDVLRRQQLLCALREGPFGSVQAAEAIATQLRAGERLAPWSGRWYPGRVVMITRNDHAVRLYNGDVGICVPINVDDGSSLLQVAFELPPDASGVAASSNGVRLFDPSTLPPHEDAFALTVHKSQGSEYDRVAVLLPPEVESPLLTRQTLYTGLSRARKSLELWSVEASTKKAISSVLRRNGQLAARCRLT